MKITKTTAVLFVDRIEPHLPFWKERLGYEATVEVPHGDDGLGFVILQRGKAEMMLQTYESGRADLPRVMERLPKEGATAFFHEVDDLDAVLKRIDGVEVLEGPRVAFYGMREVFVRDSAGFVHGYAQPV